MRMPRARIVRSTRLLVLGCIASLAVACANAEPEVPPVQQNQPSAEATQPERPVEPADSKASPSKKPERSGPITLAFAGDIHFWEQIRRKLDDDPEHVLDPIKPALSDADLTVVNLETAVATGGEAEDKNYTFRTPPSGLDALAAAGVDVVTMANNHGVDYGRGGLDESLAAKADGPVDVIGIGKDEDEAFAPAVHTVRGTKISVIGATAFPLDPTVQRWPAGPSKAGIAVALDPDRLLGEVRKVRKTSDLVVVYVHWGTERDSCPNAIQRGLAKKLEAAGADVIIGSHPHVLQGAGRLGDSFVAYSLGNFVWYSRNSDREATTGVLKLTLDGRRV